MHRRQRGGEVHCYFRLTHWILQLLPNTEHPSPLHSSPVLYHGCQCAISNPPSRPLDSIQKTDAFCSRLPVCQLLHRQIGVQYLAMTHSKSKQSFHRHTAERFSKNNKAWKKKAQLIWPLELVKLFFSKSFTSQKCFLSPAKIKSNFPNSFKEQR